MPAGIAITFPTSPIQGQTYLAQNGFTYIYDSQKNRWDRGGEFVRAPKVLSYAGVAATTTGSGITTDPFGSLIYNIPGVVIPSSSVGVESYKAYRYTDSWPNYTEVQVSISSAFSTIAYAATSTSTTFSIPAGTLSGDTTYYVRARQFVGSNASAASTGAISGYSQNIVSFATTSVFLDAPTIVSIAGSTRFPVYQIGFAGTTLPATVTYSGSGLGNLQRVEWRVTGPRNADSTGDTALAEVGIGTFSSATLANALVLAMPFSGATGVGITNDVNGAIRTASGASAGTTKTITAVGGIGTASVGIATTTAHFYPSAAFFDGVNDYAEAASSSDFAFGTDDFTFEFWYYHISGADRGLFANNSGSSVGINFLVGASGPFRVYNGTAGNNLFDLTASPVTNTWQHLTLVRKSGLLSLFVNGVLQRTVDWTGVNAGNAATFSIGSAFGNARFAFGYIQDLKIYKGLAKYQENFTPPLPTYGTISYTTRTIGSVGVATTAFNKSTGDIPTAEASSTAANALVLAMPMNRTFGFQDINVAVRGLTSGASAGTAKTVGLGTTSTANAPSHPIISSSESKWYDGAAYFDGSNDVLTISTTTDFSMSSSSFTLEAWIYPTSTSGERGIFSFYDTNGNQRSYILGIKDSTIWWLRSDNGTNTTSSQVGSIYSNSWYHLALCKSGTITNIFLNGVLVSSIGNDYSSLYSSSTTFDIGIGDRNNGGGVKFIGYIQDAKVYKGLAKYPANFTPPQPICGFTTDLATQTGFTTTSATGVALTSIVGLGSTSTLAFAADQTYAGITSITSSSGITTLPDPYAQNLVLALPLANITGAGSDFTSDRNTQIRTTSLVGGGTTKTITNTGVTTSTAVTKWYGNTASFNGSSGYTSLQDVSDFQVGAENFTMEAWVYATGDGGGNFVASGTNDGNSIAGSSWLFSLSSARTSRVHVGSTGYNLTHPSVTQNKWVHVAFVRNQTNLRLYYDGVIVGELSGVVGTVNNGTATYTPAVGSGVFANVRYYFNGYIQDLRIYKGVAKYTTNFTPPPPMFGDYVRSTPNRIVFTPGSDYALEARNTSGIVTSNYSATRQWGTKPKGGIYDPYASNLVLAIPGGAVSAATSTYDVTGQIKYETPTATYVNAGIVTYSNSLGIGTYGNKNITNVGNVSISSTIGKFYGTRSVQFNGTSNYLTTPSTSDFAIKQSNFTIEMWVYPTVAKDGNTILSLGTPRSTLYWIVQIFASGAFGFGSGNGAWNFESGGDAGSLASSTGLVPINTWTHIAIERIGTSLVYFCNGVLVKTISNAPFGSATHGGTFYFGTYFENTNNDGSFFAGYVNDLRIYKGIAKYTSNFTPPTQIYLT